MNTNRIIALVTALFLAAVMSGCSASLESPKSAQDQSAEIAALRAEVRQLLAAQQQAGERTDQAMTLEDMTPPPAHMTPMGPPQNWAWTDARPDGCPDEYALQIQNRTNFYINLLIDGIAISNRGAVGRLPSFARKSTIWICLNRAGKHVFSGERIVNRMGAAVVDARFHFPVEFSSDSDMHLFEMTSTNTHLDIP